MPSGRSAGLANEAVALDRGATVAAAEYWLVFWYADDVGDACVTVMLGGAKVAGAALGWKDDCVHQEDGMAVASGATAAGACHCEGAVAVAEVAVPAAAAALPQIDDVVVVLVLDAAAMEEDDAVDETDEDDAVNAAADDDDDEVMLANDGIESRGAST